MSVFGDFQQVWLQRFPESPLPGAWEEDVRANLAKHKQKVSLLKEELEKEEFYVEYLERLLSDVEQHKMKMAKEKITELDESNDVIGDTISKVNIWFFLVLLNLFSHSIISCLNKVWYTMLVHTH